MKKDKKIWGKAKDLNSEERWKVKSLNVMKDDI